MTRKSLPSLPKLQGALDPKEMTDFLKEFDEDSLRETIPTQVVGGALDSMIKGDNRTKDDTVGSDHEDGASTSTKGATFVSSGKAPEKSKSQEKRERKRARERDEKGSKGKEGTSSQGGKDTRPQPPEPKEGGSKSKETKKDTPKTQETASISTDNDPQMPDLTDIPIDINIWDPSLMIRKIDPRKISTHEAAYLSISALDFNSGEVSTEKTYALWKISIYNKIVDHKEGLPRDLTLLLIDMWKSTTERSNYLEGMIDGACMCSEMTDRMKALDLFRSVERAEKRMTKLLSQGEASAKSTIDQTEKMNMLINKLSSLAASLQGDYDQMKLTVSQTKPRPQSIPESSRGIEDAPLPVKKTKIVYASKYSKITWSKEKDRAVDIQIRVPKEEFKDIASTYQETFLALCKEDQESWMMMEPVDLIEVLTKMRHSGPFNSTIIQVAVNMLYSDGKIRDDVFKVISK